MEIQQERQQIGLHGKSAVLRTCEEEVICDIIFERILANTHEGEIGAKLKATSISTTVHSQIVLIFWQHFGMTCQVFALQYTGGL